MLILNFTEENKHKSFWFRPKKEYQLDMTSFVCNKNIFYVVNLTENDLNEKEVISLLDKYKGFVLDTNDDKINKKISKYFFDGRLYYKRAFVSSLANKLKAFDIVNLCVYDDDFHFSSEWIEVAQKCKAVSVIGKSNIELEKFSDFCFMEYGLNVFVNEQPFQDNSTIYVDLNTLNRQKSLSFTYAKTTVELIADKKYFIINESVKKLVSLGVSRELACAAVEAVPYKRVYNMQ